LVLNEKYKYWGEALKNGKSGSKKPKELVGRRELFKKYGPYTAPVVVSMLVPETAYGANAGTVYSTSQACVDAGGHNSGMRQHCMVDGRAGGSMTHNVINPGPVS